MPFQRILANSIEKENSKQVKTKEETKGLIKTVRLDIREAKKIMPIGKSQKGVAYRIVYRKYPANG